MTTEYSAAGLPAGVESALTPISDPELRHGVFDLFEQARAMAIAGEVDLVVLAARRLACVYQLMVAHGMEPLPSDCTVVSDRFLDVDLQNGPVKWNSALILDDSVILGTTLLRLHKDVSDKLGGSARIASRAVCVDVDQSAQYMLDAVNFTALHKRDWEAVQQFSEEVVVALFDGGIPFFSDFPTTAPLSFTTSEWEKHLQNADWRVADVTAPLFDGTRREALVQVPTDNVVDEFVSRIPRAVAALVDDFKVRSYATIGDEDPEVRLVPIAMLAPCSPAELDAALEEVVGGDGTWRAWHPITKHRLVQMFASSCALDLMLATSGGPYSSLSASMLDGLQIDLYFGDSSGDVTDVFDAAIARFRDAPRTDANRPPRDLLRRPAPSWVLNDDAVREVLWANAELISYTGLPEMPDPGTASKVGLVFAHAISSVFGFITAELEIPQRRQIRDLGDLKKYDALFGQMPERRVLAQGITMRDLMEALAPQLLAGSAWSRSLVSLGVDIGNDLGIVVPVTRYDERQNLVYRSYRLGETAPLAGKPLARSAVDSDWDCFAQAAQRGAPIKNALVPLTERHLPAVVDSAPLDTLRDTIVRAVPGVVVHRLEGVVLEVTESEFTAEFRDDELEPPVRFTTFPRNQLGRNRYAIKRGSLVVWTVMDRQDDIPERTSRVQIRREPPLDTAQMTYDAAALSDLLHVDDAAVSTR